MGAGASAASASASEHTYVVPDTTLDMAQCLDNPIILKHLLLKHVDATAPSRKILDCAILLHTLSRLSDAAEAQVAALALHTGFIADDAPHPLDEVGCGVDTKVRTACQAAAALPCGENVVEHYTTVFGPLQQLLMISMETIAWKEFIEDDSALQNVLKQKPLKMVGITYNEERKRLQMGS
jgi:hypothetical protein